MKTARMCLFAFAAVMAMLSGGCALHSEISVSAQGTYQPSILSPPQYAEVHTTWKFHVN